MVTLKKKFLIGKDWTACLRNLPLGLLSTARKRSKKTKCTLSSYFESSSAVPSSQRAGKATSKTACTGTLIRIVWIIRRKGITLSIIKISRGMVDSTSTSTKYSTPAKCNSSTWCKLGSRLRRNRIYLRLLSSVVFKRVRNWLSVSASTITLTFARSMISSTTSTRITISCGSTSVCHLSTGLRILDCVKCTGRKAKRTNTSATAATKPTAPSA